MNIKLSGRDQIIVGSVAIVLILVLGVVFLVMPKVRLIASRQAEIVAIEDERAAADALLRQRQDAKTAAADTQARLLRLANQIPDNPELPTLIVELQDTANEAGLEFSSLTPAAAVDSRGAYSALPIDMRLIGSWSDCMDYLRRLNKLTREVKVLSVVLGLSSATPAASQTATESAAEKKAPTLDVTVKIEAYVLTGTGAGTAVPGAPGN